MNKDEMAGFARKFLLNSSSLVREYTIERFVGLLLFSLHAYIKFESGLIGHERKEYALLFKKALHLVNFDPLVKRVNNTLFEYVAGNEGDLVKALQELPKKITTLRTQDESLMRDKALQEKDMKFRRALSLVSSNRFDGALSLCNSLSEEFPNDYVLHHDIAWALFDKKHIECLTYFEKCVAIKPDDAASFAAMGQVLRKTNKYKLAEECFRKALEVKPDEIVYLFNLSRVYIDSGRWADAKATLMKVLAIDPDLNPARQALKFVTTSLRDTV